MSAAAVPDPAPSTDRSNALSINLTVKTMLLVAVIVGLAWAFVYIREAVMTTAVIHTESRPAFLELPFNTLSCCPAR